MAVQPTTLALDTLADAARRDEAPPKKLRPGFSFETPLGRCRIEIKSKERIDGGSDRWLAGCLFWRGAQEAAPADPSFALELAAVKESRS